MESRRKRNWALTLKWVYYSLLLILCTVLQTLPGFLQLGAAKPVFILPLCLAVATFEGEFTGALFGAVGGLMWDYTAGRTVGLLAISLLCLCFIIAIVAELYLKTTPWNFILLTALMALAMLSIDYLFFYVMPGYAAAANRYLTYVLPTMVLTALGALPLFYVVRAIGEKTRLPE